MNTRWGILATGRIAHEFATGIEAAQKSTLKAVASRTQANARQFAEAHPTLSTVHNSYDALLDDPDVDAIYIATPHTEHAAWTLRALQAGKAVLCEKPMGVNHAQVMAMVDAADRYESFLMEAFMYRVHPQTHKLVELIRSGRIGAVRHIEAQFGFAAPYNPTSRLFANDLAGGGIMDVGCYPVSLARLLVGEPNQITSAGHVGDSGVDEWASAILSFDDDVTAQVSTAVRVNLKNEVTIYGTDGYIEVPAPWHPGNQSDWRFSVRGSVDEELTGSQSNIYALEADHVADCLSQKALESPFMTWQDSLGNAAVLDQWRLQVGVTFKQEQPEHHPGPLSGHLGKRSDLTIPSTPLRGLDKPVSRLVMGCDNQPSISHASVMWDAFFERGGNCYDTAFIYGGGTMESLLGHWHTQRGIRDELVIIGKGAHSPNCFPETISRELDASLDRLQTDCLDLYFLHRDNPDIPVGEFVDALNQEVARGRIRLFGGSNWTLERFREARLWAEANATHTMTTLSNNLSLARMISPVWPGVDSVSDEFADYLEKEQIALFPWSSQARGFFTDWGGRVLREHEAKRLSVTGTEPTASELLRVWDSPENRSRRDRAERLADELGSELIHVALAYVLAQPFPSFPLIGPRTLSELASSTRALSIDLTAEQVAYLTG